MAIFVELTTDPFIERFRQVAGDKTRTKGAGLTKVRRPLRGLEVKEDTYAYIKLIRADGVSIPLLDAGTDSGKTEEYSNFIIQSIQEQRMERHQIVETFGDTYVFLFGAAPHMLNCSAVLINSHDFNWKDEFMENYQRYMRGTKALEYGARTYLFYDQNVVEGYLLNANVSISSMEPLMAQLQFQFFVTNAQSIALLGDPWFPVRDSVVLPDGVSLVESWGGETTELVLDQTLEGSAYWLQGSGNSAAQRPALAVSPPPVNLAAPVNTWLQGVSTDVNEWVSAQQQSFNDYVNPPKPAIPTPTLPLYRHEFEASNWARTRPIREKTYAIDASTGQLASDEYTGPMQPTYSELTDLKLQQAVQDLENLEHALNNLMHTYGVDTLTRGSPSFWEQMGLQPTFTSSGVVFGAGSTPSSGGAFWGSYAGPSQIGGFVGTSSTIPNFASVNTAFVGVGGSFGGNASAGAQLRAGYSWSSGAAASSYAAASASVPGSAGAQLQAAARAGGYAGSNDYLAYSAKGASTPMSSSYNSAGASTITPGTPVAFALVSSGGSLQNTGVSAAVVVNGRQVL